MQGPQHARGKTLAITVPTWKACGLRIAWAKGQRSKEVDWIGMHFSMDLGARLVVHRIPASLWTDTKEEAAKGRKLGLIPYHRLRKFADRTTPAAKVDIIADTCPWGIGDIREHAPTGVTLELSTDAITEEDCNCFRVEMGVAVGQATWEALSVLVALRIWGKFIKDRRVALKIQSRPSASQRSRRLSSHSPIPNGLGAEAATVLETFSMSELLQEHVPDKLNVRARGDRR